MLRPMPRRQVLAGLASCCAAGRAWAAPGGFPEDANLFVAGPSGGRADHWAELISPPLGRALQQGAALPRHNVGGPDGVTGANQFEAHAAPDGSTALLVPGEAALSWLCGDTRVKFDAARWVPVWGGSTSAALASRVQLAPGRRLRVAVTNLVGPDLAGLLALDLMGIEVIPVHLASGGPVPAARPDIDACVLRGPSLRDPSGALAANGWALALGFGTVNRAGEAVRDPAFPELPTAQELIVRPRQDAAAELIAALRAVATAARLDVALVLPSLCPAAVVAWWRQGCGTLAQAPDVQAEASRAMFRPMSPQAASASTSGIAVDVSVLLELRRWLAERYQWRPV